MLKVEKEEEDDFKSFMY